MILQNFHGPFDSRDIFSAVQNYYVTDPWLKFHLAPKKFYREKFGQEKKEQKALRPQNTSKEFFPYVFTVNKTKAEIFLTLLHYQNITSV